MGREVSGMARIRTQRGQPSSEPALAARGFVTDLRGGRWLWVAGLAGTAASGCAGGTWSGAPGATAAHDTVRVETVALGDVQPFRHFEPSIAVDPDRPDRVLVASTVRREQPFATEVVVWFSSDGGRTWGAPEPLLRRGYARLAHGGGDPVAVAGVDGRFHVATLVEELPDAAGGRRRAGLAIGTWDPVVDSAAPGVLTRLAEIAMYEGSEQLDPGADVAPLSRAPDVEVVRAASRAGASGADKEWIAVDRSDGPGRGTLYAVWDEVTPHGMGRAMWGVSRDGGSRFRARPLRVAGPQRGSRFLQLVTRPNGTVDVLWVNYGRAAVTHAASPDGGDSWSDPESVSALAPVTLPTGAFYFDQLTAAATPEGGLVACGVAVPAWKAGEAGGASPPGQVYCATASDGRRWRSPVMVDRQASAVPAGRWRGRVAADTSRTVLPVAAATPGALWVMAYRITSDSTRVVLYRSGDRGASWREAATLAARGFGAGGIRALGSPGRFDPGDYQGLAGAGDRLYAAFVLPVGDDPGGPAGLFVSRIEVP